jgi:hypothetical protein
MLSAHQPWLAAVNARATSRATTILKQLCGAGKCFSIGTVGIVMDPAADMNRPQGRGNDLYRAFPQASDRRQPCVGVVGRIANSEDFRHEDSVGSPSLAGKYAISYARNALFKTEGVVETRGGRNKAGDGRLCASGVPVRALATVQAPSH